MRFSFKKALATVLTVALVLTTFVGALSTSAVAAVGGSITLADVAAEAGDSTFALDATLTLDTAASGVEFAYKFADLPAGMAITGVTSDVATVNVAGTGNVVYVSCATEVSSIPMTVTFSMTDVATGSYTISIVKTDYADAAEGDLAITYTDTAAVVVHGPAATLSSDENGHYYACVIEGCDHKYSEAAHNPAAAVEEDRVEATCTEAGSYNSVVYCADCGYKISTTPATIPTVAHTPGEAVQENVVEATCNTAGSYDSVISCTVCGQEISRTPATIPATGAHTAGEAVQEDVVAATCSTEGSYNSVVRCTECGEIISSTPGTIEKLPHTPAAAVEESRVEATCGADGSYDSVVYCSVCNEEISRTPVTIPATGEHTYAYVDNGDGTHTGTCSVCGDVVTEDHTYTDGTCVCGATETPAGPTEDATLTFSGASVGFGTSSLQIAFRVTNTVLAKYPDMDLVIIPQKYDTATMNLVPEPTEIVINKANLANSGSTRKQYYYTDIQLYELGLNVDYMLRAYDSTGADRKLVAVSPVYTTSAASYLKNSIATVSDAKFKTLATDTLVVCDAVMANVGASYPGSNLATATSVIEGFDISNASPSVGAYNTVNDFNSYDAAYGTASSFVHQIRTSVQIGKVPFINFRIKDSGKVLDRSKLSVTVSYTSKDSAGEHPYTKTFTGTDFTNAGSYINCKFDEIGLHDSDKDILFEVSYDGTKVCDLTYSVETYTGENQSGTIGAVATALLKLGQSFRSYQNL